MGSTLLTHTKGGCMGSIMLDTSKHIKLVAPSFTIGVDGIGSFVLETDMIPSGKLEPSFCCKKCSESVPQNQIGDDISCTCVICGTMKPVNEISIHSEIATICSQCIDDVTLYCKAGKIVPEMRTKQVRDYVNMFGLTKNIKSKTVPLEKVLLIPINL